MAAVVSSRYVADIQYDDGDSEEMYLDQILSFIISDEECEMWRNLGKNEKSQFENTTWPPPSLSERHIIPTRKLLSHVF